MRTPILLITLAGSLLLAACSQMVPKAPEPSEQHLRAQAATPPGEAPEVVTTAPYVPPPKPEPQAERYTLVVSEVPVKEVLFALARDAEVNVDIDPKVSGTVTLNAVDQTLPQILDRIARQADIRWERRDGTIVVEPDTPYLRSYFVDYINMSRKSDGTVKVATQIESAIDETSGTSVGNNNSTTSLEGKTNNQFWETLVRNVSAILGKKTIAASGGQIPVTDSVIPNPESGVLTVRATSTQHKQIQEFLDRVVRNARRQVMIEATLIDVRLSERYQAGIDWSVVLNQIAGLGAKAVLSPNVPATIGSAAGVDLLSITYKNSGDPQNDPGRQIQSTISLLHQFGDLNVLSSPKLMVLNNQTAVLKVAKNKVYFTSEVTTVPLSQTNNTAVVTATPHSVPVGLVLSITPQINDKDEIILNVRPTISRVVDNIDNPDPNFANATPTPTIPEIAIKEMESILHLQNGEVAVLGGLMEDAVESEKTQTPLLHKVPILGDLLFTGDSTNTTRTELVIFLRPVIVKEPSIRDDLADFRPYLQNRVGSTAPQ